MTIEALQKESLKRMQFLQVSKEYIQNFKENGITHYVRNGQMVPITSDLKKQIFQLQQSYNMLFFYVMFNKIEIELTGEVKEIYTFLCVDQLDYAEDDMHLLKSGYHTACEWSSKTNYNEFILALLTGKDGMLERQFNPHLVHKIV